ncbi:MAG: hypothetical protein OEV40_16965 [Acidimicrobiia bacterium]|nr:hypothetical protein [Acidimicrobiia bacterium]
MSGVEKIQDAETRVAEMQDALATLQDGLRRAEAVAVAAEEAKQRSEQLLKATVGLIALAILLLVSSARKRRDQPDL